MARGAGEAARRVTAGSRTTTSTTTTATASSTASTDIADQVRAAAARGEGCRVIGSATWVDAGSAVRASETISTAALTGITHYVPGDLTLTARAGTTLAEIADATGAEGQWLALDPHGADEGTLGATIATSSSGPLATHFGTPRDLTLGLEVVTGTGAIARGGGRVVKNVAGFDLTRLMTGAWGTLGVITELSIRLHARPARDETVAVALAGDGEAGIGAVRAFLRAAPFTPYSCEIVNECLAAALGLGKSAVAVFRLAGNDDGVAAERLALRTLGELVDHDPRVWRALRSAEPKHAVVFRLSARPTAIAALWALVVTRALPGAALVHATPARGVVRVIVPDGAAAALDGTVSSAPVSGAAEALAGAIIRAAARVTGTTIVGERLPPALWPVCGSRPNDELSRRLKAAFDPAGVLNPGLLGTSA